MITGSSVRSVCRGRGRAPRRWRFRDGDADAGNRAEGQLEFAHRLAALGLMRWRTRRTLPMACTPAASTSTVWSRSRGGIETDGGRDAIPAVTGPYGRLGDVDQGFDGRVARGAIALERQGRVLAAGLADHDRRQTCGGTVSMLAR